MSRRLDDTRTRELFAGPVIAGKELEPNHAIWLRNQAIPKLIKFLSDAEAAGDIPSYLAGPTRLGLLHLARLLGAPTR